MKVGDLVFLKGTIWSSYSHEGEVGMLLETKVMTNRYGRRSSTEFSRVLWTKDSDVGLVKTEHLGVVNESR